MSLRNTFVSLLLVHLAVLALFLFGCQNQAGRADNIVKEQTPGAASGAGATLTGPANSGAASTQIATRRTGFYPSWANWNFRWGKQAPAATPAGTNSDREKTAAEAAGLPPYPLPAWTEERTETTLGQHQDAAGILQVATAMGGWGRARWFGLLCMFAAYSGLLWAHGNPEGYPLVCWKIGAIGVALAVFDPSPWWLLLLLIPAAFYAYQKVKPLLP